MPSDSKKPASNSPPSSFPPEAWGCADTSPPASSGSNSNPPVLPDVDSIGHIPEIPGESHVELVYIIATLPFECRRVEMDLYADGKHKKDESVTHYSKKKKREFKWKYDIPYKIKPGKLYEVKLKWYKEIWNDSKKDPGPRPSFIFHDVRQLLFLDLTDVRMEGSESLDIRLGIRITLGHKSDAKQLEEEEAWNTVGNVFGII